MHKVIQIIYDCIHGDIFRRFVAVVKEIAGAALFLTGNMGEYIFIIISFNSYKSKYAKKAFL
ncbi:MAG: hypothetical protein KA407_00220 [Spirochaetes bacterium]|nr:hypothetical protein [Spirochaetota bacterium]